MGDRRGRTLERRPNVQAGKGSLLGSGRRELVQDGHLAQDLQSYLRREGIVVASWSHAETTDPLEDRWRDATVTVVIPEFVTGRLFSPTQLLHNQSAAALKLALLFRKGTVVTSVPWHLDDEPDDGKAG